ncbi:MAG: SufS family cysteine desulfurase [Verrucomicrobia bacterium]|nr:SufS family cysteine desulfurase [Verrucomicrobiota bacterium]
MSEPIPVIPGGFAPPGIGETAHSDLVAGLFREQLSRKLPSSAPDPGFSIPNADVVEHFEPSTFASTPYLDSYAGAPDYSAYPETYPTSYSDASDSPISFTNFEEMDPLPTPAVSESAPVSTSPISELSLENHEFQPYSPSHSQDGALNPPPIHSLSPGSVSTESLATTEPSRPDLPFGEPLGPRPNLLLDPSLQGAKPSPDGTQAIPLTGYSETPSYYFLDEPAPQSISNPKTGTSDSALLPSTSFNVEAVRRDFPILSEKNSGKPLIFLDNAATTQKPQSVIDATSYFYEHDNSNIHRAAYELSVRATEAFEGARDKVADFLGARSSKEIVFTRGTTEAINLVANTFGRRFIGQGDEIILSQLEHHANIVPWQMLAKQVGAVIKVIPINDRGELILEEYIRLLGPRTKLVSVAHVANSLGTINPIEEIIQIAHAHGVHVLVDGAQSTPHIPINVQALDADFLVFSGHKVFGPTGIGALYGKSHLLEMLPPWQGGGHMIRDVTFERTIFQDAPEKFEAGTPNIAGAVGLGAAIDYIHKVGIHNIAAYEHSLLEYATPRLAAVRGLRPIGTAARKASVLSFVILGIPNDTIASHLDKQGIAVRSGHHCAMPAIRHFGLESSVRPSLAFYNTTDEIDALVAALHEITSTHRP